MTTYADLGISPIINAWGTVTQVGGALMKNEVLTAMADAGRHFVSMSELHEAAGQYIAKRLGVEAAYISCGASAGMTLAAAACMGGTNPIVRDQLPDTNNIKNEIITFRYMRNKYDQALRVAGAKFVEIGWPKKTEEWELASAFTDMTAAVIYIVENETPGGIPLERIIKISHEKEIPVILDAAAELPPAENLKRYSHIGVDLTIFSGGKDICGPQTTGLIVGNRELVEACAFHACPNHSIGRGMKVGKEEIMGFLTALDLYLEQDFEQEMAIWEEQVDYVVGQLASIPGIEAKRVLPGNRGIQPTCIPRAHIKWGSGITTKKPEEIRSALYNEGKPRIAVGVASDAIVINPQTLKQGEERIVVERIKEILI